MKLPAAAFALFGFIFSSTVFAHSNELPCARYSDEEIRTAQEGFRCVTTKGVVFELIKKGPAWSGWYPRNIQVWKDLRLGLLIGDTLTTVMWSDAQKSCSDAKTSVLRGNLEGYHWRLPTGYWENCNGKLGLPNKDSDLVELINDGFGEVVPPLNISWSATRSDCISEKGKVFTLLGSRGIDTHYEEAYLDAFCVAEQ